MPEIDTPVAGETISVADFGALVPPRVISRYADSSARDAASPSPSAGEACYLTGSDEFQIFDGSAWIPYGGWHNWSPSWTGLTVGNGTETAKYARVGKLVVARYRLVFGSTSSVDASQPSLTLPVTAADTGTMAGLMRILDASPPNSYYAEARLSSTTAAIFRPFTSSGTYLSTGTMTSSVPMTWTTNDTLEGMFVYEAA